MVIRTQWQQLKDTFKGAWTRDSFETKVQYRIEAATSVLAPLLVLLATFEVNYQYWRRSDEHFVWTVTISLAMLAFSLKTLLFACSSLEAHLAKVANDKDEAHEDEAHEDEAHEDEAHEDEAHEDEAQKPLRGSPMLVFAAFLFTAGAGFTTVEAVEHYYGPIGLVDVYGNRAEFSSPWGDILLAASAICMLVEEFILLTMYDTVKREAMRVRELLNEEDIRKLVSEANASARKVGDALDRAKTHGGDVKKYSDQAGALLKRTKEWQSGAEKSFGQLRGNMIVLMLVVVVVAGVGGLYFVDQLRQYDRSIQSGLAQLRDLTRQSTEEVGGEPGGPADAPAEVGAPAEQVDIPSASDEPPAQAVAPAGNDEPEGEAGVPDGQQAPVPPDGSGEQLEPDDGSATSDEAVEQSDTPQPRRPADVASGSDQAREAPQ